MDMLIFVEGMQKGQRYPVEVDSLSLGRDRSNDIPLDDPGASRVHAYVLRTADGLKLTDSKSTNGTYLNARRISDSPLGHGDRITIGDTVILVEMSSPQPAAQVVVSDQAHDQTGEISVRMDSTLILAPVGGTDTEAVAAAQAPFFTLFHFITHISGILDLDHLLRAALEKMSSALKADQGSILFLDKTDTLEPRCTWPEKKNDIVISRTITERVLESRQAILYNPNSTRAGLSETVSISARDVGSVLCVPLLIEDQTQGIVYLETGGTSLPFSEQSLRLLSAMAMQLAIMVENARLYHSLRNAEEFAACILKSMAGGLIVIDNRSVVIRANAAAMQILGLAQKDLVGTPIAGLPQLKEFAALVEETRATGIPLDRAELLVDVGTHRIPLGVNTTIMESYDGKALGAIVSFRDLTRLKKMAEEVKRSQHLASLGEMAAGIAHEIRNPLNSVQGFAQLLMEDAQKRGCKENSEYAGIIIEEVARIDGIVQDMLDFSRQRELTMNTLNLTELVFSVERQMQADFTKENIKLRVVVQDKFEPQLVGSYDKLKQVLLNIIGNACQACSAGGAVEVSLSEVTEGLTVCSEAVIKVRDDGCGIAPEAMERVFNPFFTTKDHGTGLGLPICQKIIEQHSGRIEIESEAGLGSTFSTFLPMTEAK